MVEQANPSKVSPAVFLAVSADRLPSGQSLSLDWKVAGGGETVTGVQLSCASDTGLEMIEAVARQGARQLILIRPGTFTFTLTANLRDGGQRYKQIHVRVDG